jgi:hypothetical protein
LCLAHQVICVDFNFGDQLCHFQATFSAQDRPQALAIAVAIASASADTQATVHVNGVLLYGNVMQMVPGGQDITMALPLLVPNANLPNELGSTTVSPVNHHFINLLIEENSESFAFNNGMWRISQEFWFGDVRVEVSSLFVSHRVSLAWTRSMAMSQASGRFIGGTIVPPAAWTVNLPANYWDL